MLSHKPAKNRSYSHRWRNVPLMCMLLINTPQNLRFSYQGNAIALIVFDRVYKCLGVLQHTKILAEVVTASAFRRRSLFFNSLHRWGHQNLVVLRQLRSIDCACEVQHRTAMKSVNTKFATMLACRR